MEIIKSNWNNETINQIIDDIKDAHYVSIDTELTGIDPNIRSEFDSMDTRISKHFKTANAYSIMQLGICTYKKLNNNSIDNNFNNIEYACKPYNIYIFPNSLSNKTLKLEIGAINFNSNYNFDFNKWLKEGVVFLDEEELNKEKDYLIKTNLNLFKPYSPIVINKQKDKELIEDVKAKITKLIKDFDLNNKCNLITVEIPNKYLCYGLIESLETSLKERIYFEEEITDDMDNKNKKILKIFAFKSKNERNNKLDYYMKEELNLHLKKAKGAKVIFDTLVENKSKVIGHNCILDFMFMLSHFDKKFPSQNSISEINSNINNNLESQFDKMNLDKSKNSNKNSISSFSNILKNKLKLLFGCIYDTKYIFKSYCQMFNIDLNKHNLESVYLYLYKLNEEINNDAKCISIGNIEVNNIKSLLFTLDHKNKHDNRYGDKNVKSFHEAGYDAYVTGIVFLIMQNIMTSSYNLNNIANNDVLTNFNYDNYYKGKFNVMNSIYESFDIYLKEDILLYKNYKFIGYVKRSNSSIKNNIKSFDDIINYLNKENKVIKLIKENGCEKIGVFYNADTSSHLFINELNNLVNKFKNQHQYKNIDFYDSILSMTK